MCWNKMSILRNNPTKWLPLLVTDSLRSCLPLRLRWLGKRRGKYVWEDEETWASALEEWRGQPHLWLLFGCVACSQLSIMLSIQGACCYTLDSWLSRTTHALYEWKQDAVFENTLLSMASFIWRLYQAIVVLMTYTLCSFYGSKWEGQELI